MKLPARSLLFLSFSDLTLYAPAQETNNIDARGVEQKLIASYYHPKDLSGLDCEAQLDWDAFLHAIGAREENEASKAMRGITIHVHSTTNKKTEVTVKWPDDTPTIVGKPMQDQMADGLRQMISGFMTAYWSGTDTSKIPEAGNLRAEKMPDGTYKLLFKMGDTEGETQLDSEYRPVRGRMKDLLKTADVRLTYAPSPVSQDGDRYRLVGFEGTETMGVNSQTGVMNFDYQDVEGYHIPKVVHVSVPGAFTIGFTYTGCHTTVTKSVKLDDHLPSGSVTVKQTVKPIKSEKK